MAVTALIVIADIKRRLNAGKPVRVVSTQLVEAGVDLDFPVVYRALAGLDSIAQAAGRCNREGRMERGEVVVFVPPEPAPPGVMRRAAAKTVSVLAGNGEDPLARRNFSAFFRLFYDDTEPDDKGINRLLAPGDGLEVQFRTAAKRFRIIDDTGQAILVRYYPVKDKNTGELDRTMDMLLNTLRAEGPSRWLMRKLQRYSVNVSDWCFRQLQEDSQIEEIHSGIWAQMAGTTLYDPVLGLALTTGMPSASELVI